MEDVLREVCGMAEAGYREAVLTGIHLSSYGIDFKGDDRYNGRVDYDNKSSYTKAVSLTADTTGILSRTVPCGEARLDGITLVQYRPSGTGGTLSLIWDGAVLAPTRTRNIIDVTGKPLLEAEFRRNAAIPATTSLQLRTICNVGGDIALHSWAMAAI